MTAKRNLAALRRNALLNDVSETNVDGLMAMALERMSQLPEDEKKALTNLIDKYCIAVSLQGMMDNEGSTIFGLSALTVKTEELIK